MKLLLDENISDRLVGRLADLYPSSEHVCTAGLGGVEDEVIWEYAKQRGLHIVTQDSDYANLVQIYGAPPKVIWLKCGNSPTRLVEHILRQNAEILLALEANRDLHVIELF